MTFKDTATGYSRVSIAFHWIGAALIVALWLLGDRIDDFPRGPDKVAAQNLHFAVGMLAFAILAARIGWRLANPVNPSAAHGADWQGRIARIVQIALLTLIAVMIITGPVSIWAGGKAIDVFGVTLASPLSRIDGLHKGLEVVHKLGSKLLLVLVALHVLGALKHLVVDRDGVVRRMLVPTRG